MLGMFLNKKDGEALGESIHQGTMEIARRSNRSLRESMAARMSFEDIVAEKDQALSREIALNNAYMGVVGDLVDLSDTATLEKIRYLRSRHLDAELNKLLASGHLTIDPRLDADWRASTNYRAA